MTADRVSGMQLDSFESEHLVGSIMDGVLRTPQERGRTLASFRSALAVAAAVILVAGGLIVGPRLMSFGTAGGGTLATYHADGLQFDYPAAWDRTPSSFQMSPDVRFAAFVGTGQGDVECTPVPDGSGARLCNMFSINLAPNQIVIEVAVDDSAPLQTTHWLNPPISEPNTIIGGMPAIKGRSVAVASKVGADVVTCWVLQSPQDPNRHYVLTAAWRGPNRADLQAQVDALLASVRFDR